MKKYIYTIVLLWCVTFINSSCNKFLNTEPEDFLAPTNYYTNAEQMDMAIAGVYDMLGKFDMYEQGLLVRFATEADEGYYSESYIQTGAQFYQMSSTDVYTTRLWTNLYDGIARANLVLENVQKPDITEKKRNQIKGEALFLRAYYYFLLVTYFGDVPLRLSSITDVKSLDIKRSSPTEVYEQITKDMIEAEPLVPDITELKFGGRISKSAVRGILARVYLHWAGFPLMNTAKYKDARDWAKKVIDDPIAKHSLNSSYIDIFKNYAQNKYDISESIWEVEFKSTSQGTEWGRVGAYIGIPSTNSTIGAAWGFMAVTPHQYWRYENGDARRDYNIASFTYASGATTKVYKTHPVTNSNIFITYVGKYRREDETDAPKGSNVTPINLPLLRYSDVLLMFAEAENELKNGPTPEAIEAVNKVRHRAWSTGIKDITITSPGDGYTSTPKVTISGGGGTGASATATVAGGKVTGIVFDRDPYTSLAIGSNYSSPPTIIFSGGGGSGASATATIHQKSDATITAANMNKTDFLNFLRDERSRELCFEALRKYDLLRWGILLPTLKQVGNDIKAWAPANRQFAATSFMNFEAPKHYRLPIPNDEMTLNKLATQNPGY